MSCILCGNEPECWCYDGYTCRACRLEDERDEARAVARLIADSFALGDWQALLSTQQQNPWLCEEEKS